jgi:hypothetical protein
MARFIALLLLIACAAFGLHVFLAETKPAPEGPKEVNADKLKLVSVVEPAKAREETQAVKKLAELTSGGACVEFGVRAQDAARAQAQFADAKAGDRVTQRSVEEFSKYSVSLPPYDTRKGASDAIDALRKAGLKELQIMTDNGISLGVFSTEEAARRHYSDLERKVRNLVKNAVITPRNPVTKETIFTLREPDTRLVARLTLMQREFEGSTLKAAACPGGAVPVTATAPTTSAPTTTTTTTANVSPPVDPAKKP